MASTNTWKSWLRGTKLDRAQGGEENSIKPLFTIDLDDEEQILNWHKQVWSVCEEMHDARTSMYMRNRDLYAGLHSPSRRRIGLLTDTLTEWGQSNYRVPEVSINHSFELTEQIVSKLSRFSTTVDVLPVNTEEGDRNAARASQRYADHLGDVHDLKSLFIRFVRDSRIGGESFIVVDYDPNKGDLHPSQKEAKKKGIRVPLLGEDGEQIYGESGEPLYIEKAQRVGDLDFRLRSVPEILLQPKKRWPLVEWYCEVDLVDVDELKALYKDKAGLIDEAYDTSQKRTTSTGEEIPNSIIKYTYVHKGVPNLDSGRKIVLIDNCVLYNDVNPFSGAPLNIVRLTDIDIEGELHGWSFINNIAVPQLVLNKLYTLWYKNIALGSHLYWLLPANARIARDKITNSASVIQYFGTQKPEIAVFRTVAPELLQLIDKIEQRILTVSRVQSTSRGELPPNVEAGVAISILEEQENQAMTPDIKKVNASVEKLYKLALGIAGDKFEKGDGRTARILGKEGEFLLEEVDVAKLSGPYDIKVKKATAFSQSKPLLIKEITQLEAMRPNFLSNEELYDLLDLGDRNKFYDITTAARRAAEFENERMREGRDVPEPTEDEYLLVHWDSHATFVQTPSYKIQSSQDVRELFRAHMITTEMRLIERAKKNVALAQKLAAIEYFPMFYDPDFELPEILMALQQGQILPALGVVETPEEEMGAQMQTPTELDPEGEAIPPAAPEEMGEVMPEEQFPPGEEPEPTGPQL